MLVGLLASQYLLCEDDVLAGPPSMWIRHLKERFGGRQGFPAHPPGLEMEFPRKGKPTMKKLLFAVSALAALSLLAPSTGLAQATNIMSIYADEAASANSVDSAPFSTIDVYLVITNPYNHDEARPIDAIAGVEFAVPTPTNATILGFNWPVDVVDVGTGINHIVGFGQNVAVSGGMATLCSIQFIYTSATSAPAYFTLAPATPASAEGFMAVLDAGDEGNIIEVLPPYENFDFNVFAVNDAVATESSTMDAVKALYR